MRTTPDLVLLVAIGHARELLAHVALLLLLLGLLLHKASLLRLHAHTHVASLLGLHHAATKLYAARLETCGLRAERVVLLRRLRGLVLVLVQRSLLHLAKDVGRSVFVVLAVLLLLLLLLQRLRLLRLRGSRTARHLTRKTRNVCHTSLLGLLIRVALGVPHRKIL